MNILSIDPGTKNFAIVKFRRNIPLLCYLLPMPSKVCIPDEFKPFSFFFFSLINSVGGVVIERYIPFGQRKGSTELINLLIGSIITSSQILGKSIVAKTNSWKRAIDYKEIVAYAKESLYESGDIHFIDAMLLYSVVHNLDPLSIVKKGYKCRKIYGSL